MKRVIFLATLVVSTIFAAYECVASIPTTSDVVCGQWMGNFHAATNLAHTLRRPLVMFWANENCPECQKLQDGVILSPFKEWQAEHGDFVYCFVEGRKGVDVAPNVGAKEFAKYACGTRSSKTGLGLYPFMCLWWPQGSDVMSVTSFVGRTGMMLVKADERMDEARLKVKDPEMLQLLAKELQDSADLFFKDYKPVATYQFADSGTEWDRYEAEPGKTSFVDVEVLRSRDDGRTDGFSIDVNYPDNEKTNVAFAWQDGATAALVRVPVPLSFSEEDVGKAVLLSVKAPGGAEVAVGSIALVEKENGSNNPLWVTERTIETLAFGEWTADMDVATQKVAQTEGQAWTLVELAGSLWCPDCYRTDVNFIEDGTKLRDWALARQVALVSVDTPHNSAALPDQTIGTIWNRAPDQTRLIIDGPNADTNKVVRSGKGYLSRKMISDEEAAVVAERNLWYSREYFHRPEDYASHRTLIPIFILLDKNGQVVGRFETFDDRAWSPTNTLHTSAYLKRFDEMIELATNGVDRAVEVGNNHWSTTSAALPANGNATGVISHSDFHDVYELTGVRAGSHVSVSLSSADSTNPLTLQIIKVEDGMATTIAESSGNLTETGFSLKAEIGQVTEARYFVQVMADVTRDEFLATSPDSTITPYSLTSSYVLVPGGVYFGEQAQSVIAADGSATIAVLRNGGISGAVTVQVCLKDFDPAFSECFDWQDQEVSWADGEDGERLVTLPIDAPGIGTNTTALTFALAKVSGDASVSSGQHVLTVTGTDKPYFPSSQLSATGYAGFGGVMASFPVQNVGEGKLTISYAKGSDRLPSGLKLSYDAVLGCVLLTGKTTKTGSYEVTFTAKVKRANGTVTSDPITLDLEVKDASDSNSWLSVKRDQNAPVLTEDGGFVAGTLQVKMTASGRLTAKYAGTESKTLSFSGLWNTLDETTGTAETVLSKNGAILALSMERSGKMTAQLTLPGVYSFFAEGGVATFAGKFGTPAAADFSDFVGEYNVTLPVREDAAVGAVCGTGYLRLKITSSAAKTGKVSYSGIMPSGRAFSGTSTLSLATDVLGARAAYLTVFKRASRDVFGARLLIRADGAANWNSQTDIAAREVVGGAPDSQPYCLLRSSEDDGLVPCDVYGSWYKPNVTAETLAETFYGSPVAAFKLSVDTTRMPTSDHGTLSLESAAVEASNGKFVLADILSGFSFSCKMKTGLFSGKATGTFADGSEVTGKFKGILMPGWHENCDCGESVIERPFASGFFQYTDKVNGVRVVRTLPVVLDAVE